MNPGRERKDGKTIWNRLLNGQEGIVWWLYHHPLYGSDGGGSTLAGMAPVCFSASLFCECFCDFCCEFILRSFSLIIIRESDFKNPATYCKQTFFVPTHTLKPPLPHFPSLYSHFLIPQQPFPSYPAPKIPNFISFLTSTLLPRLPPKKGATANGRPLAICCPPVARTPPTARSATA